MDRNTRSNNFNNMWMFIKIPKSTGVTILNIDNTHTMELGQWVLTGELQMGTARLAQFGGELAEPAINATNSGQNAMAKVLVLTALVSFSGRLFEAILMGSRVRFGMRVHKRTKKAREGLAKGSCTASSGGGSQWAKVTFGSIIRGAITDRIAE